MFLKPFSIFNCFCLWPLATFFRDRPSSCRFYHTRFPKSPEPNQSIPKVRHVCKPRMWKFSSSSRARIDRSRSDYRVSISGLSWFAIAIFKITYKTIEKKISLKNSLKFNIIIVLSSCRNHNLSEFVLIKHSICCTCQIHSVSIIFKFLYKIQTKKQKDGMPSCLLAPRTPYSVCTNILHLNRKIRFSCFD